MPCGSSSTVPKRRNPPSERNRQIFQMWQDTNLTLKQIGEYFGIDKRRVSAILKQFPEYRNDPNKAPRYQFSRVEEVKEQVRKLYDDGIPLYIICERLNIHYKTGMKCLEMTEEPPP